MVQKQPQIDIRHIRHKLYVSDCNNYSSKIGDFKSRFVQMSYYERRISWDGVKREKFSKYLTPFFFFFVDSFVAVESPTTQTGLRCTTPPGCQTPAAWSTAITVDWTTRGHGGQR